MKHVSGATRRKDRRRLPRNVVRTRQWFTVYFEEQSSRESTIAVIMDLTPKGAGLFCEEHIAKGTKIVLEVKLRHHDEEIALPCTVVWSGKVPTTNRVIKIDPKLAFKFGVRFSAESEEEKEAIALLNDALGEKQDDASKDKKTDQGSASGSATGAAPLPQAA